jgi:hypothetical protein
MHWKLALAGPRPRAKDKDLTQKQTWLAIRASSGLPIVPVWVYSSPAKIFAIIHLSQSLVVRVIKNYPGI